MLLLQAENEAPCLQLWNGGNIFPGLEAHWRVLKLK